MISGVATGTGLIHMEEESNIDFFIHELYPIDFFGHTVYIASSTLSPIMSPQPMR